MDKRVVITGMGWVTPLGHQIETVWARMLAGESGIGPISHFDASTFPTTFAAQVKNYDYRKFVHHPELHEGVGLNTAFALGAASPAGSRLRAGTGRRSPAGPVGRSNGLGL